MFNGTHIYRVELTEHNMALQLDYDTTPAGMYDHYRCTIETPALGQFSSWTVEWWMSTAFFEGTAAIYTVDHATKDDLTIELSSQPGLERIASPD